MKRYLVTCEHAVNADGSPYQYVTKAVDRESVEKRVAETACARSGYPHVIEEADRDLVL